MSHSTDPTTHGHSYLAPSKSSHAMTYADTDKASPSAADMGVQHTSFSSGISAMDTTGAITGAAYGGMSGILAKAEGAPIQRSDDEDRAKRYVFTKDVENPRHVVDRSESDKTGFR